MTGTGERAQLRPAQQRAVVALLQFRNVAEAATATGTPARTIYRWLREEGFRAALVVAEGAAIDAATRRLVTLSGKAIDVFDGLLDASSPPTVRLRAAAGVLEYLLRLRELRDLEARLTRLEEAYGLQDQSAT
jgi:hypothetical protein